jgi:hypothetical protein
MPVEGEKKPCTFPGCKEEMVWKQHGAPPGTRVGVGGEGGAIVWAGKHGPGWFCDKNPDHYAER